MDGGMELRIINRQTEMIMSTNLMAEPFTPAYKKPVGTLLISFLELDLNDQDSFNRFVDEWGIGGLISYSETACRLCNDTVSANKETLALLLKESHAELRSAQRILSDMAYCIIDGNAPEWAYGLTPRHRFYVYQELHENNLRIIKDVYDKNLTIDFEADPKHTIDSFNQEPTIETEAELAKLIMDKDIDIVESYVSGDIAAICYAELKEMIANSTVIKKCKRCGLYFMPAKRIDEEYCDRTAKTLLDGSRRTCKDIGPSEKRLNAISNDPILDAYNRAYKTVNARIRAKGKKRITKEDFYIWKADAEAKIEEAKQGKITVDEFKKWLKS
ncbi:MAG: DUF6076 domain-containing protein [Desulfotomaculaceae bacterium]|nr:DUF6076 domain-containing protein [Desulfotomaculaceae bacterium]